jgi:4-hydroxybenzoyl-CoA reductase subunit beta
VRLPTFTYLEPGSLDQAFDMLSLHGAQCRILAGGTDLLVRMKQRLTTASHLMSLRRLDVLSGIEAKDEGIRIGAATPLSAIIGSELLKAAFPGLVEAARAVGAPSIQHHRGTIGGNICQENRCQFYNQSDFFRGARQPCHKAGGQVCYAKPGGSDRCHSICQSDTAPVLCAAGARVTLRKKEGTRTLPLFEFYSSTGEHPFTLADDEILTDILLPSPRAGAASAYAKLAFRSAIDYPVVSAGAAVRVEDGAIREARLVIGAVASAPLAIPAAARLLEGRPAGDAEAVTGVCKAAMDTAAAFVMNHMAAPVEYRVQMVSVLARRAIESAVSRALAYKTS